MSNTPRTAKQIIDAGQIEFLGKAPTREQMSQWFNACLNSGCGPIAERYGDIALVPLLSMWLGTVRARVEKKSGGAEP